MSMALQYAMKKKAKKMAEGGEAGVNRPYDTTRSDKGRGSGTSEAGIHARGQKMAEEAGQKVAAPARHGMALRAHRKTLSEMESMRGQDRTNLAEGGEVDDDDFVSRIMAKRCYSQGGRVANADHGEDDKMLADFMPNEFDDLVNRDDLESHYTGANSGDEDGVSMKDMDEDDDLVSRVMRKRKDRNPRPA